jgi:hypothetical protein
VPSTRTDGELVINDDPYKYRAYRLEEGRGGMARLVRLTKEGGKRRGTTYHVARYDSGLVACTCPDHFFRHRACKHIDTCQLKGLL